MVKAELIPTCCMGCLWISECEGTYQWEQLLQDNPQVINCHRTFDYEDTDGKTPKENAIELMLLIGERKTAISERDFEIENYWNDKTFKFSKSFAKHYTGELANLYVICNDKLRKIEKKMAEYGIYIATNPSKNSVHIDSLEHVLKQLFWRK